MEEARERTPDAATGMSEGLDLSVVIPALHEGTNVALLVPALREVLGELRLRHEILVVSPRSDPDTIGAATAAGATAVVQDKPGYGGALVSGFDQARGAYILTMDADLSHRPIFLNDLWAARNDAEITIASRYVAGGSATMPAARRVLSRILNVVFSRGLALPIRDMSSGFRLYRAAVVRAQRWKGRHFDILQEILVHTCAEGWRVREMPFDYAPRAHGSSHARVFGFGLAYLRTFWRLWALRNSILAADYDDRAHDSVIPLQRYWQRQRFRHVTELIPDRRPVLDVGCGSSRIIGALPPGSVGVDVLLRKLRHARRFSRFLVQASGFSLPFPDNSFSCVICSQVIEHVPKDTTILDELCRVLAPGGRLILGTPDYDRWEWVVTENPLRIRRPRGLRRRAHRPLHPARAGRALHGARLRARGDALHPARRAHPRLPEAGSVVAPAAQRRGPVTGGPLRSGAGSVATFALVLAAFLGEVIAGRRLYWKSDLSGLMHPLFYVWSECLKRWDFSALLWTPNILAGHPLLAEGQMGAFYPPNWLLMALSPEAAVSGSLVLGYSLTLVATAWLARLLGMSHGAALASGAVFAFGGFAACHVVHANIVAAIPWLPIVLGLTELGFRRRQWAWWLLAGFCWGAQWLVGHPQVPVMTGLMTVVWVGTRALTTESTWRRRFLAMVVPLFLIVPSALGLAAAYLLPILELGRISIRAGAVMAYSDAAFLSLEPQVLVTGILPFFYGPPEAYRGPPTFYEFGFYAGSATLIFAAAAVAVRPRRRWALFFAAIAVVSLLLALGHYTPAYRLAHLLPGLRSLRVPARFVFLLDFGLAMLAGLGLDALAGASHAPAVARGLAVAALGIAAACWAAAGAEAWPSVVALALGAALLGVAGRMRPDAWRALAVLLLLADLWTYWTRAHAHHRVLAHEAVTVDPALAFVASQAGPYDRVARMVRADIHHSNHSILYGLNGARRLRRHSHPPCGSLRDHHGARRLLAAHAAQPGRRPIRGRGCGPASAPRFIPRRCRVPAGLAIGRARARSPHPRVLRPAGNAGGRGPPRRFLRRMAGLPRDPRSSG